MQTKQTIAIIGATGNMGSAISKAIAKGNYNLLLKATKLEELDALVNEINLKNKGAVASGTVCPTEASWERVFCLMLWSCHQTGNL